MEGSNKIFMVDQPSPPLPCFFTTFCSLCPLCPCLSLGIPVCYPIVLTYLLLQSPTQNYHVLLIAYTHTQYYLRVYV